MKKFLSVFLAVLMCVAPFATSLAVYATPIATFTLGSDTAAPGETVEIPVTVTTTEAVQSFGLGTLQYDTDALEYVGISAWDSAIASKLNTMLSGVPEELYVSPIFNTAEAYSGTICTLTFKVKDTAVAGPYTITYEKANSMASMTATVPDTAAIVPATITVEEAVKAPVVIEAAELATLISSNMGAGLTGALNGDYFSVKPVAEGATTGCAADNVIFDFSSKNINVEDYQYVKIVAKRNFTGEANMNIKFSSTDVIDYTNNGKHYWPGTFALGNDGVEASYVKRAVRDGATVAPFNGKWTELRICPYVNNATGTMALTDSLDIKYIGFFNTKAEAEAYGEVVKYDVTFWNGTTQVGTTQKLAEGEAVVFEAAPEATAGKQFKGWALDGTTDVLASYTVGTANVKFVAIFEDVVEYVIYDAADVVTYSVAAMNDKNYTDQSKTLTVGNVNTAVLNEGFARFTPTAEKIDGTTKAANTDRYIVELPESIDPTEYPTVAIAYKTNVGGSSLNINLVTGTKSGTDYKDFKTPNGRKTDGTLALAKATLSANRTPVYGVYAPVWHDTNHVLTANDYFDIQFIGFFKTADAADTYFNTLNPTKYDVTFWNGDDQVGTTQKLVEGEAVVFEAAPNAPAGKQFKGWALDGTTDVLASYTVGTANVKFVAIFEDAAQQPTDVVIITAEQIAGGLSVAQMSDNQNVNNSFIKAGNIATAALNEGFARFVTSAVGTAATTGDRLVIDFDDVATADYPYIAMAYKTNIVTGNVNFNISYNSPSNGDTSATSGDFKGFHPQARVSDGTVALAKGTLDTNRPMVKGVYVPIYSTSAAAMAATDYFDVQYIGFFKTEEDLNNFDYSQYTPSIPNEYTIKFWNGSEQIGTDLVLEEGDAITFPAAPTAPAGKAFVGWAVKGTTTVVETAGLTATADAEYEAIFEDIETFTIKFYSDNAGTTQLGNDLVLETGAAVTFPAAPAAPTGFYFTGWALKGTTELVDTSAVIATADAEYVPVFEEAVAVDALVFSADDIVADGMFTDSNLANIGLVRIGDDTFARFAPVDVKQNGSTTFATDSVLLDFTGKDINVAEYTHFTIAYKRNFEGLGAPNFRITGDAALNGTDVNFWPTGANVPSDDTVTTYTKVTKMKADSTANILGFRIGVYGNNAPSVITLDDHVDVQYVAFFKSADDAANFVYDAWYAENAEPAATYTVTYKDQNGETITTETIAANSLPAYPEVEVGTGEILDGWVVEGTEEILGVNYTITSDVTLQAAVRTIRYFQIYFTDGMGNIIEGADAIEEGTIIELPTEGYTVPANKEFAGWALPNGTILTEAFAASADAVIVPTFKDIDASVAYAFYAEDLKSAGVSGTAQLSSIVSTVETTPEGVKYLALTIPETAEHDGTQNSFVQIKFPGNTIKTADYKYMVVNYITNISNEADGMVQAGVQITDGVAKTELYKYIIGAAPVITDGNPVTGKFVVDLTMENGALRAPYQTGSAGAGIHFMKIMPWGVGNNSGTTGLRNFNEGEYFGIVSVAFFADEQAANEFDMTGEEVTVTFVDENGETVLNTQTVDIGTGIVLPEVPAVAGKVLSHWVDVEDADETPITDNFAPSADMTLKAVYTTVTEYTITYLVEGLLYETVVVPVSSSKITHPVAPTLDGYTFNGWVDETGAYVYNNANVISDMVLNAKFATGGSFDDDQEDSVIKTFITILRMITKKKEAGGSTGTTETTTPSVKPNTEAIIYDAAAIIADGRSVAEIADGAGLLKAGNVNLGTLVDGAVRFTSAAPGTASGTGDRLVITADNVVLADYPYVALAYKTNIKADNVNFNMTTANGTYSAREQKLFFPQARKADGNVQIAIAKYSGLFDGDTKAEATSIYVPLWSNTSAVMNAEDYFDVVAVGFFKTEKEAKAFVK